MASPSPLPYETYYIRRTRTPTPNQTTKPYEIIETATTLM